MARNGSQRPARPRTEIPPGTASPEEAAAIAAAIEQFLLDTAPPPPPARPPPNPWLRASLREGVGLGPADPSPWGEP